MMLCDTMFADRYVLEFQGNLLPQSSGYVNMFLLFPTLPHPPGSTSPSPRHSTACY